MPRRQFERIYETHFDTVFRYVLSSVARRDVAEDIAAEAFLRLLREGDRIDESRLPAWLITVSRNLIVDYWRCAAREGPLDGQEEPRAEGSDVDLAALLVDRAELQPGHRACLILRYVHDMDRSEIAEHTGFTDNQVKSCLQYGLKVLRKVLVKQ